MLRFVCEVDATMRHVAMWREHRRHIVNVMFDIGGILAIASTWHDESSRLILGRCTPGMLNALDNITVSQYVEPADNFYFYFYFF